MVTPSDSIGKNWYKNWYKKKTFVLPSNESLDPGILNKFLGTSIDALNQHGPYKAKTLRKNKYQFMTKELSEGALFLKIGQKKTESFKCRTRKSL